eukprot:3455476-Pleurochrysis_carterae.AAC.1
MRAGVQKAIPLVRMCVLNVIEANMSAGMTRSVLGCHEHAATLTRQDGHGAAAHRTERAGEFWQMTERAGRKGGRSLITHRAAGRELRVRLAARGPSTAAAVMFTKCAGGE